MAQIIHAIGYLHHNGIAYRGLDTDSILIGLDGYIKLDGFMHARQINSNEKVYSLFKNK